MSLRQLAGLAKVSNAYISQIERGIYRPSATVLKKIADALHVSAEALFARIGLLEQEPGQAEAPGVEEAVLADPRLAEDQKEALIGVYRSFLAENGTPPRAPRRRRAPTAKKGPRRA